MRKAVDFGPRVPLATAAVASLDCGPIHEAPIQRPQGRSCQQGRLGLAGAQSQFGTGDVAPEPVMTLFEDNARLSAQRTAVDTIRPCPRRSPGLRRRLGSHRSSLVSNMALLPMAVVLFLSMLPRPAAAVSIPFDNCLPEVYRENKPTPLQWFPLRVEAAFDTTTPRHNLLVTMWGNVTGSWYNVTLPPPDSPAWLDPTRPDGKILRDPEPESDAPKITTLRNKVNFLTYEPFHESTDFCNTSLAHGKCPLAPVFNTSVVPLDNLPSVSMTNDFYSSYAFASFSATFLIIYGDAKGTNIGCVSATITPDLGNLAWMLKILPLVVLLSVGAATAFAGVFSPWGTADVFHWTSNYGRDADLLRLVTPGFGDCLQYIQFVALTGGLTLNYPGFYQPIVSHASWSALMFNESFVSKSPGFQSLVDGIYVTNGFYGLQDLSQLVGMSNVEDIWAGMIVWLLVIIACMFVVVQAGFMMQWIYRYLKNIPEEDLRAKNIPFSLGNVIRIVFNYFLFPIVALSTFQLVVSSLSPAYPVALAVVTLILIVGFAAWLLYLIATTKPRAFLFDDLPTLLLYGPLYNTYSDEAAAFALIPVLLTFLRGIAVGAVQLSGVAQLVLLAICEVIQILTLHAFRPFQSPTSMNAYHTLFSALRLITVLLMVAFVPSLDVSEGAKGWIGYAILLAHAGVLVLGFLLNALQTSVEVIARMLGAGGDDVRGQTRGGLSKIFGMRQLSRRMSRRETGPSRQSQLSASAIDAEKGSKAGSLRPDGRVRRSSQQSIGILLHRRQRSSSQGLENLSLEAPTRVLESGASSFTPTTPGEASIFSFLPSPGGATRPPNSVAMQASDPYYRPPRARRTTMELSASPSERAGGSRGSIDMSSPRGAALMLGGLVPDPAELDGQISRGATPAPYSHPAVSPAPRTDYSTREVDFYYGVRGQKLNSGAPNRKLGTGPADPTGPMASAAGWFRGLLGGKRKEKSKGFEVVRSGRAPPPMMRVATSRGNDFATDDAPPEGIPVATGVLRNGPIESDDEDDVVAQRQRRRLSKALAAHAAKHQHAPGETELLDMDGHPHDDDSDAADERPPMVSPEIIGSGGSIGLPNRPELDGSPKQRGDARMGVNIPYIPRRSSRRHSGPSTPTFSYHSRNPSQAPSLNVLSPSEPPRHQHSHSDAGPSTAPGTPSSRLPFERNPSRQNGQSSTPSLVDIDLSGSSGQMTTASSSGLQGRPTGHTLDERPTAYGYVNHGSIGRVDRSVDLLGREAEVVDLRR